MEGRRASEAPPKANRKKILTQAEKNQIRNFHHSHPLVTHTQIASFFGLERSTVTKIIGQPSSSSHAETPSSTSAYSKPSSYGSSSAANGASATTTPPDGHMSLEAFQTQSYVTRALTLWAQQKQQQGVRVTQKMIRQEAATLAARHERSMRSSGDSTSSADSLGMGRSVSPQYYSRSPSTSTSATSASSYSNSGVGSSAGWNPDWSLSDEHRPNGSSVYGTAASAPSASYAPSGWPAPASYALPAASGLDLGSNSHYMSSSHREAFRQTTERLRSGSEPQNALDDLAAYLKSDTEGLSSFDFLCLEHLRERVASNKRGSTGHALPEWASPAASRSLQRPDLQSGMLR